MNRNLTTYKSSNSNACKGVLAYRFSFNGQEKDDEIYGEGNALSATFWEYDARIGRRWNLDPKPDPSLSWYSTFAGNPISNSDQLGDTIKGNTQAVNDYKNAVNNKISEVDNEIKKAQDEIALRTQAGKSTKKLETRIENLNKQKTEYKAIFKEISTLENSTQVYYVNTNAILPSDYEGSVTYDNSTENININLSSGFSTGTIAHELKHAYQFDIGQVFFDPTTGEGSMSDLVDELDAYRRGKLFGFDPGVQLSTVGMTQIKLLNGTRMYTSEKHFQYCFKTKVNAAGKETTLSNNLKKTTYIRATNGLGPSVIYKNWQIYYNQATSGGIYESFE